MAFDEGVEGTEVGYGDVRVPEMGAAQLVQVVRFCRGTFALQLVDERIKYEEEGWRICVVWVLDLKLLGNFAASFRAQDLFPSNPSVIVHEAEPAFDDIEAAGS